MYPVLYYAADCVLFAPLCGSREKTDVMLLQNKWRNVHCNTEGAEPCLHGLPSSAVNSPAARTVCQQRRCLSMLMVRSYKQRRKYSSAIWSLHVQASPCTFPQHRALAAIHQPPFLPPPPVCPSSLLACNQAGYRSDGVPLFLIGRPQRRGGAASQPLYIHCCRTERRSRAAGAKRMRRGEQKLVDTCFSQTITIETTAVTLTTDLHSNVY